MSVPLRAPILWLSERPLVRRAITETAPGRRLVGRFVAGDTLEDAIAAARALRAEGARAMLDHLGENVRSRTQCAVATDAYVRALERIRESAELGANISVKLTQLGLDASIDLCLENMRRVLEVAGRTDPPTLVMIDMEASEYVERTLDVYLRLRERHGNVGVCLQAYLRRTAGDARRVAGAEAVVRVCKGAYLEPPAIAFPSRTEVRRSFAAVAATLLAAGSTVHVATHDPDLVAGATRFVRGRRLPPDRYEFQFLYGVRRDLQASLSRAGEPVRVYVPYGTHWYPYLARRLAERPANLWFFLSNAVRRDGARGRGLLGEAGETPGLPRAGGAPRLPEGSRAASGADGRMLPEAAGGVR